MLMFDCQDTSGKLVIPVGNPTHYYKMGHVGGRRFSVGEIHAASKTSSANGSHLNVWDFDISAAEFPQQKKRASLV